MPVTLLELKHEIKDLQVCESRKSVQDACDLTGQNFVSVSACVKCIDS